MELRARGKDYWFRELERRLDDDALPSRMGAAGRAVVEARHSAETQAPRLTAIVRSFGS
jgi:hypothetical protein